MSTRTELLVAERGFMAIPLQTGKPGLCSLGGRSGFRGKNDLYQNPRRLRFPREAATAVSFAAAPVALVINITADDSAPAEAKMPA